MPADDMAKACHLYAEHLRDSFLMKFLLANKFGKVLLVCCKCGALLTPPLRVLCAIGYGD